MSPAIEPLVSPARVRVEPDLGAGGADRSKCQYNADCRCETDTAKARQVLHGTPPEHLVFLMPIFTPRGWTGHVDIPAALKFPLSVTSQQVQEYFHNYSR